MGVGGGKEKVEKENIRNREEIPEKALRSSEKGGVDLEPLRSHPALRLHDQSTDKSQSAHLTTCLTPSAEPHLTLLCSICIGSPCGHL